MKRLEPSWLHRRNSWQLGHAPSGWYTSFCPGDESVVWDLGSWTFGTGLIAGLATLHDELGWFRCVAGSVSLVLFLLGIGHHIRVYEPFLSRERFARARIRRHECVICGTKLRGIPDEICTDCRQSEAVPVTTSD